MKEEEQYERLVAAVYDAAMEPARWPGFVDLLAETFRGSATLFTHTYGNAQAGMVESARFDPAFIAAYGEYYNHLNPWMARLQGAPAGTFVNDPIPYAELTATEFYNDWMRPQGFAHSMGEIWSTATS